MGITFSTDDLLLVLEEAIDRARADAPITSVWKGRVDRLGRVGIKTYVAALGAALLAKATDPRVDVLTQDAAAGARGYSLRTVAELMAERNLGRFHMGATGRNPMNNRPFLGGPPRIDEFEKISRKARPAYEAYRDCLIELNRLSSDQAKTALVAWLRVRMDAQAAEVEERRRALNLTTTLGPATLIDAAERFVREDPEGGRRAQAFVAAALDCAFDDVVLQPINDPRPGDVQVRRGGAVVWIVEVKQLPVAERTAFDLAAAARAMGVHLALLVVIADRHPPLERERIRRQSLRDQQVMVHVAESVGELLGTIAMFSTTSLEQIVERLPGRYAERMREHEVSTRGRQRWAEVIAARRS